MRNNKFNILIQNYEAKTIVNCYGHGYMFPKNRIASSDNVLGTPCAGVIGGTFIPNVEKMSKEDLDKLDEKEFQSILDRCAFFFSGHGFR